MQRFTLSSNLAFSKCLTWNETLTMFPKCFSEEVCIKLHIILKMHLLLICSMFVKFKYSVFQNVYPWKSKNSLKFTKFCERLGLAFKPTELLFVNSQEKCNFKLMCLLTCSAILEIIHILITYFKQLHFKNCIYTQLDIFVIVLMLFFLVLFYRSWRNMQFCDRRRLWRHVQPLPWLGSGIPSSPKTARSPSPCSEGTFAAV